jgi:hypothetical protein
MKTHILHLCLLLALFILMQSSSCSNKNKNEEETVCTPQNTVLVPQDLKDRFFFKVGTYWIYQNIQTNETDSLWVWVSYQESISVNDEHYGYIKDKCYEQFATSIMSELYKSSSRYTSYSISIYPKKEDGGELFGLEESTPLNNFGAIYRLENRGGQYENQEGVEITMLDTLLTQNNIVYKNVLHLKYPTGQQTNDYLDDMYYAKNIGLVKFHRFTDTSNWELIRSHIVQ